MDRRLIIDGNAVYELDEKCMLRKKQDERSTYEGKDMGHSNAVRKEKGRTE